LDGDLQPADLHIWEQSADQYFTKMKVPKAKKVTNILSFFHTLRISNWIESSKNTTTANKYTFPNFMSDFQEHFLEEGWVRIIYCSEIK
jgi:uncharacterized protein YfbU (UPF0304 family)